MNRVVKITIEGKEVNLKFGFHASREFTRRTQQDIHFTDGVPNELGIGIMLHCAYVNYCLLNDEPVDLKLPFFVDYTEDLLLSGGIAPIQAILEDWVEASLKGLVLMSNGNINLSN